MESPKNQDVIGKSIYYTSKIISIFLGATSIYWNFKFIQTLKSQVEYDSFLWAVILGIISIVISFYSKGWMERPPKENIEQVENRRTFFYNTHVQLWDILVLGAILTSLFYFSIFSVNADNNYSFQLLLEKMAYRGIIPILTCYFFFSLIGGGILKLPSFLRINNSVRNFNNKVVTGDFRLFRREEKLFNSFLGRRIVRYKTGDGETYLDYFAELDREELSSSYTFIRFLLWAIPVLGFIGTVWGIGQSITGFTNALTQSDVSGLSAELLGPSLSFLGVAFDTTLVALSLGVIAMFFAAFLQKLEETLLTKCHLILSRSQSFEIEPEISPIHAI